MPLSCPLRRAFLFAQGVARWSNSVLWAEVPLEARAWSQTAPSPSTSRGCLYHGGHRAWKPTGGISWSPAGSFRQSEDQVSAASLSQGHCSPTSPCSHPSPSQEHSLEVLIVIGAAQSSSQPVAKTSFQNTHVGSPRGSAWPEAQMDVFPTSCPTTGLPQAHFPALWSLPIFRRLTPVNSKRNLRLRALPAVSATDSFQFSDIFPFILSPPHKSPGDYSVCACWQVNRDPGSSTGDHSP